MDIILSKLRALNLAEPIAVVGMGISGMAVLDVLREAGYDAIGFDENKSARHVQQVNFDDPIFKDFSTLVVSPGVDRRRGAFQHTFAQCINDVEIFARLVDKPVLAVTGSNGKSTVVTLLTEALVAIGHQVCLCGNIGDSVIDSLLKKYHEADYYVLELSSYQLELCPSLLPAVGAVLNVTPDHLDRYDGFEDYYLAKANLAKQAQITILNADDAYCRRMSEVAINSFYFGSKKVEANRVSEQAIFINNKKILTTDELSLTGTHNYGNVLCVLLMLQALGEPIDVALNVIKIFGGLDHRMQLVREKDGVKWFNDSKATNIGATAAALDGLHEPVILILGGVGKKQDFNELANLIPNTSVRMILLIGEDSKEISTALDKKGLDYTNCHTLKNAVTQAEVIAQSGDLVLLSPACASFDQFNGFVHRGECFAEFVQAL